MADLSGQTLGRYQILEQLGEGGMATVYKAYDTRLETEVAVKVIRTENILPSTLERTLKRFEREAKALAKLTHPNIVKVTDFGEHEGRPYLVMPYLPGGTLKQKLAGKPMKWQEAVKILLPIARALDFAHAQNMIHRDVKPSNILITLSGEPMLTDFGIAKILDLEETQDLTGTGMGVGTPEYMAPEQWKGKSTTQSDQYGLGIVLYEMVTGKKPYTADTPAEILIKATNDPLPRPSQFAPGLPDSLEKILLKSLAKDPAERFANMGELGRALESLLMVTPLPGREEPRRRRERTPDAPGKLKQQPKEPTLGAALVQEPQAEGIKPPFHFPKWLRSKTAGLAGGLIVIGLILIFVIGSEIGDGATLFPTRTPTVTNIPAATWTPTTTFTLVFTSTPTFPPTPVLGVDSTWVSPEDGMVMMYVPAGEFSMGSNDRGSNEQPVHTVYLDSYWIDQTEVTNAMYAKCVQAGKCDQPSNPQYYNDSSYADHPVVYVSWNDAQVYCAWRGDRLPTEAEWEKAASWDDDNKEQRIYPWGDTISCSFANYGGCEGFTTRVVSYPSGVSFYGLFDMAGNVWEWVADWYDGSYYSSSPSRNPQGPFSGTYRVLRGGSWYGIYNDVRSAVRINVSPDYTGSNFGFRCARGTSP